MKFESIYGIGGYITIMRSLDICKIVGARFFRHETGGFKGRQVLDAGLLNRMPK